MLWRQRHLLPVRFPPAVRVSSCVYVDLGPQLPFPEWHSRECQGFPTAPGQLAYLPQDFVRSLQVLSVVLAVPAAKLCPGGTGCRPGRPAAARACACTRPRSILQPGPAACAQGHSPSAGSAGRRQRQCHPGARLWAVRRRWGHLPTWQPHALRRYRLFALLQRHLRLHPPQQLVLAGERTHVIPLDTPQMLTKPCPLLSMHAGLQSICCILSCCSIVHACVFLHAVPAEHQRPRTSAAQPRPACGPSRPGQQRPCHWAR